MFTKNTVLCKIIVLVLYLASSAPAPGNDEDLADLHAVIKEDFTSDKPRVAVVSGSFWQYPQSAIGTDRISADDPGRIIAFGTPLVIQFGGLKTNAKYKLKLTYLSDSDDRIQQLSAGDVMLHDKVKLPKGEFLTTIVALPPETYRSSNIELKFIHSSGPNAVVSAIEVWPTDKNLLPQIDITANGNLKGRIKGLLRDSNNGSGISGANI